MKSYQASLLTVLNYTNGSSFLLDIDLPISSHTCIRPGNGEWSIAYCVIYGAGSMMISHANDASFRVIAKFPGLHIKKTLKVYTIATLIMGLTSLFVVRVLSKYYR